MIRQDIVVCQKCRMLKELSEECECTDEKGKSPKISTKGNKYTHAEGQRFYLIKRYTNFVERHNQYNIQYSFKKVTAKGRPKRKKSYC